MKKNLAGIVGFSLAALYLYEAPDTKAAPNPAVHEACLAARDYAGCVSAHTSEPGTQNGIQVEQTTRVAPRKEFGNSCPPGYAYGGAGRCRQVVCRPMGIFGKNEPQLTGKGHSCEGKNMEYGMLGRSSLRWGDIYIDTSYDANCPDEEPKIGALSSCTVDELRERYIKRGAN